jgi:hypothetical protein
MFVRAFVFLLVTVPSLSACAPDDPPNVLADSATPPATTSDSAFAAVQERGKDVMGVDQYTSQHVFEDLLDGGRVILERADSTDAVAIAQIRAHMRDILADFSRGDFSKPFGVHAQQVPGTAVMAERRDSLTYEVFDRAKGAELRIITSDAVALKAVHEFLAFQRMDHRAAGHDAHDGH